MSYPGSHIAHLSQRLIHVVSLEFINILIVKDYNFSALNASSGLIISFKLLQNSTL